MRSSIRNMFLLNNTLIDVPHSDEYAAELQETATELQETALELEETSELEETALELEETSELEDSQFELPAGFSDVFQTEIIDNPSVLFILQFRGRTYYYFDEASKSEKRVLSIEQFENLEKCDNFISCPICMEDTNKNIKLPCSHVFCEECIQKWLLKNTNSCPNCRINVIV